jgi:Vitamin K-dependent gamma-carboxylase
MTRILDPSWWIDAWNRFWFAPGSPRNLAAARILFAAYSFWVLVSKNLAEMSGLPPVFWSQVTASARWRYLVFPGHPELERVLVWITAIALLGVIVGVLPRLSCFVSGLLLYHLAPLESLIWIPHPYVRGLTTSVIALLTLSFSPCGDCWTLLRSRRDKMSAGSDYTWPVRLLQLYLIEIYLFSGYAKLMAVGWQWASAANIRNWMLWCTEEVQMRVFHALGTWIADRPLVCWGIGIGALLFELGLIAVLFSSWARRLLVPLAAVFHLGILLAMNLVFLNVPQLLVFVDWDRVAAWIKTRLTGPTREPTRMVAINSPR